jgi:hypothetical protein
MLAAVNAAAGKTIAHALGASDPNAWVAFATQAQWENGGTVRGNNPLNLTDPGRRLYWRAYGQTGWYTGGTAAEWHTDFAAFATLGGGAQAAAANYLHQGSYGAVLVACRSAAGPIPIADAIESSPWSSGHYGGKLAARVSAELAALFASSAAAKLPPPPQEVPPVSEQITTFSPPRHGTIPGGTRRFAAAEPYDELSPLPADGHLFDALVILDQAEPVRRGTFARMATTPPGLVIARAVAFDALPEAVVPEAAPPEQIPGPQVPDFYGRVRQGTAVYGAWSRAWLAARGLSNAEWGPIIAAASPAELLVLTAGIPIGDPGNPIPGADYSYYVGFTGTQDPATGLFLYIAYRDGKEVARQEDAAGSGPDFSAWAATTGIDPN